MTMLAEFVGAVGLVSNSMKSCGTMYLRNLFLNLWIRGVGAQYGVPRASFLLFTFIVRSAGFQWY